MLFFKNVFFKISPTPSSAFKYHQGYSYPYLKPLMWDNLFNMSHIKRNHRSAFLHQGSRE